MSKSALKIEELGFGTLGGITVAGPIVDGQYVVTINDERVKFKKLPKTLIANGIEFGLENVIECNPTWFNAEYM